MDAKKIMLKNHDSSSPFLGGVSIFYKILRVIVFMGLTFSMLFVQIGVIDFLYLDNDHSRVLSRDDSTIQKIENALLLEQSSGSNYIKTQDQRINEHRTNSSQRVMMKASMKNDFKKPRNDVVIASSHHVVHAPITIVGDADFAAQAVLEGWSGNGSASNPYVISGLDIDAGGSDIAINITDTSVHFVVQDNIIHGASYQGIFFDNVTSGQITNNTIYNNNLHGFYLSSSKNIIVKNNVISDNSYRNGYIALSSNITVESNTISSSGSVGLYFYYSNQISIIDNFIDDTGWDGITVKSGVNVSILSNIIKNSGASGMALIDAANALVTGNNLRFSRFSGMYMKNNVNMTFDSNVIYNNSENGLFFDTGNDNVTITGNNIANNGESGISSRFSSNFLISNNDITFNMIQGIYINFIPNTTIIDNIISNNGAEGVTIQRSPGTIVENNVFNNDVLYITGYWLGDYLLQSVSGNTVNGLPLEYIVNQTNPFIPTNAGEIIFINSDGITISNDPFGTVKPFIEIAFGNNINVADNVLTGLYIERSNSTTITGNVLDNPEYHGINVQYSDSNGVTISENLVMNAMGIGIIVYGSNNAYLQGNNITGSLSGGIYVSGSRNTYLQGNNITGSLSGGIYLVNSDDSSIIGNGVIQNGNNGIYVFVSINTSVGENFVLNNSWNGIRMEYSPRGTLENNSAWYNKWHGMSMFRSNSTIATGNVLAFNGWSGLGTDGSHNAIYSNNEAHNNTFYGFHVARTTNVTMTGNLARGNGESGFYLFNDEAVTITSNVAHDNGWKIQENGHGLFLHDSSSIVIENNTVFDNELSGMYLLGSENNTLRQNVVHDNARYGISLENSGSNSIINNTFVNDGLILFGTLLTHFQQDTVANNTVNGRELLYLEGVQHEEIPDNVGQIILVNSHRITIKDQDLYNTTVGIQAAFSTFLTIYNNSFSDNSYVGLFLSVGTNSSTISWNNFYRNNPTGFSQARDDGSTNAFTYNFWDDGAVIDPDNDGIVDIPYRIEGTADSEDATPLATPYSRRNMGVPTILTPNGGENVTGVITVEWTEVIHPLGKVVRYDVYYSLDGGKSWKLLASNLIGTTSVTWDTSSIKNATMALVKVIAVDTLTNFATQDTSDNTFQIDNSLLDGGEQGQDGTTADDSNSSGNDSSLPGLGIGAVLGGILALLLGGGLLAVIRRRRGGKEEDS